MNNFKVYTLTRNGIRLTRVFADTIQQARQMFAGRVVVDVFQTNELGYVMK